MNLSIEKPAAASVRTWLYSSTSLLHIVQRPRSRILYFGRLPKVGSSSPSPSPFERGDWGPGALEPESRQQPSTRRALFAMLAGSVSLTSIAWFAGRASVSPSAAPPETPSRPATGLADGPSTAQAPEWHRQMLTLDADELLRKAGEFERKSRSTSLPPALAPGFIRLLDLASVSDASYADAACACALRTLHKLGRTDLVRRWALAAPDFVESRREAQYLLDSARRRAARRERMMRRGDDR